MNAAEFNRKYEIIDAAIACYMDPSEEEYSVHRVAQRLGTNSDEIYSHFENKGDILHQFYVLTVYKYRLMTDEIEDFAEFTLAEKISNFVYASIQMLDEQRPFVKATFNSFHRNWISDSPFTKEVARLFRDFVEQDPQIGYAQHILIDYGGYHMMCFEYFNIVEEWMEKEQNNVEELLALADKWATFVEELLYVKVLDSGFDLAKYLLQHRMMRTGIPLVDKLFKK